MTSREAAILACGRRAVENYETVKSFYTKFGVEIEKAYAAEVEGVRPIPGKGGPDVVTPLGGWEFCASERSKNAAGNRKMKEMVPEGHIVQATGKVVKGRISGEEFLRKHGIANAHRRAGELLIKAAKRAGGPLLTT